MKDILPETVKQDLRRLRLNDMAAHLDEALDLAARTREGCLALAFGIRACQAGYRVAFFTAQDLLLRFHAASSHNTAHEIISSIARSHVLILDALGYVRPKPEYANLLFDVVNTCRGRVALIVTSNISFEEWGLTVGNHSIVNAIVDRLLDRACLINIRPGKSYRTEGPLAPKLTPDSH
jgi:DNA replication protein DnaC